MFRPGLRHMDVHPQAAAGGIASHPLPQGRVGGVLRMDGGVHLDLAVPRAIPLLRQGDLVPAVPTGVRRKILRRAEVHPAAGQIGADAGLQHRPGHRAGVHIHIRDAGGARSDHLRQAQGGPGGHAPGIQPGLGGENIVVQPVLKVVPPAIAPEQSHRHMGVTVDQAGQQRLALSVDHPVKLPTGMLLPHRGDLRPLHRHTGVLDHRPVRVHGHSGNISEQNFHRDLTFSSGRPGSGQRTSPGPPPRRPAPPAPTGAGPGCPPPYWTAGSGPAPPSRSVRPR